MSVYAWCVMNESLSW